MGLFLFFAQYLIASPSAHFYRNPESLFSSGQMEIELLEKTKINRVLKNLYLVEKDQRRFWVKDSDLVTGQELQSKTAGSLGIGLTLISTAFRNGPNIKAESLMHLPARTQVSILSIKDDFAEVMFQSQAQLKGYIDLNHLATVFDFVAEVIYYDKWTPVQFKSGMYLILQNQYRMPVSSVKEFKIHPQKAMVVENQEDKKLNLRSMVQIIKHESSDWNLSFLKGHGEVYWKPAALAEKNSSSETEILTNEEILKREIFSLSFQPENQRFGLISSNGIYLTQDGKSWRKIPEFKNQNWPVLITAKNELYVGHFWSQDLGKTFQPYFKFSELLIHFQKKSIPYTRNLKFESLDKTNDILKIKISTGTQNLEIQFNKKLNTFL